MILPAKISTNLLIILLHGYGTNASDFESIGNFFSLTRKDARIVIPNGFELIKEDSYKWFDLEDEDIRAWTQRIKLAGDKLATLLDDQLAYINKSENKNLNYDNVIIAGFSQGGMMALHVGLKKNISKVICFSGFLVDPSVILKNSRTNILFTHGENDTVLNINLMKNSTKILNKNGIAYEMYIEKNMQHEINQNCLLRAAQFLKED